jgi:hypothetical protein
MGFLPITLALTALMIVVVSINLTSIKRHQQSIKFALFTVCQTAASRNRLLKRSRKLSPNELCIELPEKKKFTSEITDAITNILVSERASVEDTHYILDGEEMPPRLAKSLALLNQRQSINLKILERKAREYNQLIDSYPTKMVASAWKYRPVILKSDSVGRL